MSINQYIKSIIDETRIICPDDDPKTHCEAQYAEFSAIFTWFLLTGTMATIFLEPMHKQFGTFVARVIIGTLTTSGIILLLFYEDNNYLIWGGWQLIGLPAFTYIIINITGLVS